MGITDIVSLSEFQFYDSPIKRADSYNKLNPLTRFQFYDSPIKRERQDLLSKIENTSFNSMIVRLKGRMPRGIVVRGMAVSIL